MTWRIDKSRKMKERYKDIHVLVGQAVRKVNRQTDRETER